LVSCNQILSSAMISRLWKLVFC